jgi:hypothetical protein
VTEPFAGIVTEATSFIDIIDEEPAPIVVAVVPSVVTVSWIDALFANACDTEAEKSLSTLPEVFSIVRYTAPVSADPADSLAQTLLTTMSLALNVADEDPELEQAEATRAEPAIRAIAMSAKGRERERVFIVSP